MKIVKIDIRNFKSIKQVEIANLGQCNFFFGENGVGKSNLLQALEFWYTILTLDLEEITDSEDRKRKLATYLRGHFGTNLQRANSPSNIQISVTFSLSRAQAEQTIAFLNKHGNQVAQNIATTNLLDIRIEFGVDGDAHSGSFNGQHFNLTTAQYAAWLPKWHHISEQRALQRELAGDRNLTTLPLVTDKNLKNTLFAAYLSPDLSQKRRLDTFREYLELFGFGQLDIAKDRAESVDISFIEEDTRLPLANLGAGANQLFLILGQLVFNEPMWLSLEEPEMNLSPANQKKLIDLLLALIEDESIPLGQVFITTHSPYFEFREKFYDVLYTIESGTDVIEATRKEHSLYFHDALASKDIDSKARLNSQNQITLDAELLQDMGLQRGDLVFTIKNEAGRWEIYTEEEIASRLQEAWE